YQNLAFRTKMLDSIDKLNNQPTINTKDFAYSLAEMQMARSYKRFSIKRYQHKSKSIDNYYNAIDVPQAKLRWKNAFLGFAIWSWSGIKNINISGFRSLALSIGKLIFSGLISPSFGAKYLDIPVAVTMGLYSGGFPVLTSVCKKAPEYSELIEEKKSIKQQEKLLKSYKLNGLTKKPNEIKELDEELLQRKQKLKYDIKLQNDNLKYALKGNWRSVARLGTLGAIIGLIISSGGISLLANGLIMGIGHFMYAIACGVDTDVQNNYAIWLNLKRANYFKDDVKQEDIDNIFSQLDNIINKIIKKTNSKEQIKQELEKICTEISQIIDENKVESSWLRSNQVLKSSIQDAYTYEASLLCKYINSLAYDSNFSHTNISKLEDLSTQIYLYEKNKYTQLDENGIIGRCLKSKFYLNRKSVTAAKHVTNNWYGQAAKNFGTSNISTTLNAIAEIAYYSPLHEVNKDVSNAIFTTGKTSAGFSSAAVRSLSSSKRNETKKIFELDLGEVKTVKIKSKNMHEFSYKNVCSELESIEYATNSKGNRVITSLNFKVYDDNEKEKSNDSDKIISIPVINFSPQSNQLNRAGTRYKNLVKASWVSTKAAYSIPRDVIKLNSFKI
ncbi:MAG: hypothetical protein RLZZ210_1137, partial [Pseudomonadota bacterium]